MKIRVLILMALAGFLASCQNDEGVSKTEILTTKVWGKPVIVNNNGGFWTLSGCGEYLKFDHNGNYRRTTDCDNEPFMGQWTWMSGNQIRVVEYYGGGDEMVFLLTVVKLSEDTLQVQRRIESQPGNENLYIELRYRPVP